jgi:hypothetical protein
MHWSEGCPPPIVSYVGTIVSNIQTLRLPTNLYLEQIYLCYQEWKTGEFSKIRLTSDTNTALFFDIRERVWCDWEDARYRDDIRARFSQWIQLSKMVLV